MLFTTKVFEAQQYACPIRYKCIWWHITVLHS